MLESTQYNPLDELPDQWNAIQSLLTKQCNGHNRVKLGKSIKMSNEYNHQKPTQRSHRECAVGGP